MGKRMKRQNIVMGTLILSASSIFVRMLGFVFRIYLSNTMGAQGMGVYTLILSLYGLCATVATSGIAGAVSKLVAEELVRGKPQNGLRILRRAVGISLLISCAVGVVMFVFAEPIGVYILKEPRTVLSLRLLAPGMPLMSVSSSLRGYFIARRKVGNPATGQVVEQFVKMAFIVGLMGYWLPKGLEYGCALVVLGITVGEVVCFLYSLGGFLWERTHERHRAKADIQGVTRKILGFAVPVSVSSYARSALRLLEDVLILSGLKKFSGKEDVATGEYGSIKGMVMPLLTFPLSLLSAFVVTLTPEISRLHTTGNKARLENTISTILRYTSIVGMFVMCVFMSFSGELGEIIYKDAQVGEMLRALSWLCPFMCVEMVTVSILQGLGEQVSSLRYSVTDSVLRIALVYVLIPYSGAKGFMLMVMISNLYTPLLNLYRLLKVTHIRLKLGDWVLKPGLAALVTGQMARLAYNYLLSPHMGMWQATIAGVALAVALFCVILFALGIVSPRDFKWIFSRLRRPGKALSAEPEKAY